jgi:hypothetical protein
MIRIDTVERVGHCGHTRRFDEATVRVGDLLWHHQIMGERDVDLCRRLADQMGLEFVDLRGQKYKVPDMGKFKQCWNGEPSDIAGVKT